MKTMLCIDPGLSGTGWAVFHGERLIGQGTLHAEPGGDWLDRAFDLAKKITEISCHPIQRFNLILIEKCKNLQSKKGVAALLSNAIMKLAIFTGMCVMACDPFASRVELIDVATWKGSMPKKIMDRRLAHAFGATDKQAKHPLEFLKEKIGKNSSHSRDAIGIGLSWLKKL